MKLPESLYFLRAGWWALHITSILTIFAIGAIAGHKHEAHNAHTSAHHDHAKPSAASAPHDDHKAHDHTSSATLKPLMQQMLSDATLLQSALKTHDLERAAQHAGAIAGACEEPEPSTHAPDGRLGVDFIKHDRALHHSAQKLSEALQRGDHKQALNHNLDMINQCQSCHAQSPAAQHIALHPLTSFAQTLTP